jgi:hypothetical protein
MGEYDFNIKNSKAFDGVETQIGNDVKRNLAMKYRFSSSNKKFIAYMDNYFERAKEDIFNGELRVYYIVPVEKVATLILTDGKPILVAQEIVEIG